MISTHTAVAVAKREVPSMLPKELVWPYDCTKRCSDMTPVHTGPAVGAELTRNLREPFKTMIQERF